MISFIIKRKGYKNEIKKEIDNVANNQGLPKGTYWIITNIATLLNK